MAAPMMFQQLKRSFNIAQSLERRGVLPVFATQVRFKTKMKKRTAKDPHVSTKEKKFFKQRKSLLKQAVIEEPVAYIAQEPVDDVWISTYYPESKYSLEEIIKRHKEYAQPDMFNTLKSRVYLDMNINMRTKKKTKFIHQIKNTIEAPHPFETGVKQNVVLLCKEKKDAELALQLGANRAGGAELIKLIKDGVMKKTDFDHILATPDMKQEVLGLRGPLREETPDARTGKVSDDIETMLKFFLHGITYEVVKVTDALGKLQVPFGTLDMPVDWLVENFNTCIDSINKHKPGGSPGAFINDLTIVAPPSPERFILKLEYYDPRRYKLQENVSQVEDSIHDEEASKTTLEAENS